MPLDATWQSTAAQERARLRSEMAASGFDASTMSVAPEVLNVAQRPLEGVLTAAELEITGSSVESLLARLRAGEWRAEAVTVSSLSLLPPLRQLHEGDEELTWLSL